MLLNIDSALKYELFCARISHFLIEKVAPTPSVQFQRRRDWCSSMAATVVCLLSDLADCCARTEATAAFPMFDLEGEILLVGRAFFRSQSLKLALRSNKSAVYIAPAPEKFDLRHQIAAIHRKSVRPHRVK